MTATEATWTIQSTLAWIIDYLERKGDENPRLSAQWLLSDAMGLSRAELYVNFDRPLTMDERDVLRGYVVRRGKGEPLQYITGSVAFRYITVKVREGVLIPRPETEVLVSEALSLMHEDARALESLALEEARAVASTPDSSHGAEGEAALSTNLKPALPPIRVADICTGSGCIACSIAHEWPGARVWATDLDPNAVSLATENVAALSLEDRVAVLSGDLGECLPEEVVGTLDLVISNPPYIPSAILADLPREVTAFESNVALDGGPDGLDPYRRLLAWCRRALRPGGAWAFELHETCLAAAAEEARRAGFADIRIVRDLADRPRVLLGRAPRSVDCAGPVASCASATS